MDLTADRVVIVYESMYGNTRAVAEAVATGLRVAAEVEVVPVGAATAPRVARADLVVVGGPTHVHGMTTGTSRRAAVTDPHDLTVDPDAEGPGLRDWFDTLDPAHGTLAAAFDTRVDAPPALTGRASRGIGRRLRRHGYRLVAAPESFLVDKATHLVDGEQARAVAWGETLAAAWRAASVHSS